MKYVCLIAGALALVGSASYAAPAKTPPAKPATPPRLYDFKGIPLEISLEEFRSLTHPDAYDYSVLVCNDEPLVMADGETIYPEVLRLTDVQAGNDITKCAWIDTSYDMNTRGKVVSLNLAKTWYGARGYTFDFITDPKDGKKRLFYFSGKGNSDIYYNVVKETLAKFGQPTRAVGPLRYDPVHRGKFGSVTWENPQAVFTLDRHEPVKDEMRVTYVSKRLRALVDPKAARNPAD